jgi:apolipoprotein N-acyltransferase
MRPERFRARFLLVLLSSVLFALSFPNFLEKTLHPPTAFLAWAALVPLFVALEGTLLVEAALLGFLWGFAGFGILQYWVLFLKEAEHLAVPGWAALNAIMALHYALWACAYVFLHRRFPKAGALLAPVLWTALEYLRTAPPVVGYPWGLVGASQACYPSVMHLASSTGVWGLTFLIVWVNAALATTIAASGMAPGLPRRSHAAVALPLALALLSALMGWVQTRGDIDGEARKVPRAALVQPSIDQSVKWSRAQEKATYDLLVRMTVQAARTRPSLIVWPESAAPSYLSMNRPAMERVRSIARKAGAPLLAGCLDAERIRPGRIAMYNAATHFTPKGLDLPPYRKRHLVPFGEYVPAQSFFSFLGPVVSELGSFDEGRRYETFPARGFTYTPLICYEAVFPEETRRALKGAAVLVNISNDAWYGDTAAAYQHALLAVMRSAENGKPLLRCANTGISLATTPRGRILASTPLLRRTVLEVPVIAGRGDTIYSRMGDWLAVLCSFLSLAALAAAAFQSASGDGEGDREEGEEGAG